MSLPELFTPLRRMRAVSNPQQPSPCLYCPRAPRFSQQITTVEGDSPIKLAGRNRLLPQRLVEGTEKVTAEVAFQFEILTALDEAPLAIDLGEFVGISSGADHLKR